MIMVMDVLLCCPCIAPAAPAASAAPAAPLIKATKGLELVANVELISWVQSAGAHDRLLPMWLPNAGQKPNKSSSNCWLPWITMHMHPQASDYRLKCCFVNGIGFLISSLLSAEPTTTFTQQPAHQAALCWTNNNLHTKACPSSCHTANQSSPTASSVQPRCNNTVSTTATAYHCCFVCCHQQAGVEELPSLQTFTLRMSKSLEQGSAKTNMMRQHAFLKCKTGFREVSWNCKCVSWKAHIPNMSKCSNMLPNFMIQISAETFNI